MNELKLWKLNRTDLSQYAGPTEIDENDGYFVSRLKDNANPVITAELREWRGSSSQKNWVVN